MTSLLQKGIEYSWLIPVMAFTTFVLVGLLIRPLSDRAAGYAATLGAVATALLAYAAAWAYWKGGHTEAIVTASFEWLRFQPGLSVRLGVLLDPISVLLLVVVTTVSALVHIYSLGYMHGERGFGRYYSWLSLFTFSMLGLVVAPNLLQMYVCWELVGASSFLLIGFYYDRPSAVAAAKKAFIVTRFADLGFLLGVLLLAFFGYQIHSQGGAAGLPAGVEAFDFQFLTAERTLAGFLALPPVLGAGVLTLATLLLFCGAAGKSAMFPLHVWLPDAMEGPTPVSALIHAATMVVAGVYLVARMFPAFAAAGTPLEVVAFVGAFTCLFAALIGCTQDDIKRVLAYSTLSQLGYMMFALGVASTVHRLGYTASMFHLFTHAFFKALLFLGAGAVIHAVHSNNMPDMGGLWRRMPVTHLTFLVACLAISGIWPLAGFFSKDMILLASVEAHSPVVAGIGFLVAGLTAFYMFRVYFLTFWGKARTGHAEHAHEAPFTMLLPLLILAALSALAGFVPVPAFLGLHEEGHGAMHTTVAVVSTIAAATGILTAGLLYTGSGTLAERLADALGGVYRTIRRKFYVDEAYLFVTKRILFPLVAAPIAWFDRHVVDGTVDLAGSACQATGTRLRRLQTGQVQTYSFGFVAGALVLALLLWTAWK